MKKTIEDYIVFAKKVTKKTLNGGKKYLMPLVLAGAIVTSGVKEAYSDINVYLGDNAKGDYPTQSFDFYYDSQYGSLDTAWSDLQIATPSASTPELIAFYVGNADIFSDNKKGLYIERPITMRGLSKEDSSIAAMFRNHSHCELENLTLNFSPEIGLPGIISYGPGSTGGINNCNLTAAVGMDQSDPITIENSNFYVDLPEPDNHAIFIAGPIGKKAEDRDTKVSLRMNSIIVPGGIGIDLGEGAKLDAGLEDIFGLNYFECNTLIRAGPGNNEIHTIIGDAVVDTQAMGKMALMNNSSIGIFDSLIMGVAEAAGAPIFVNDPDDLGKRYIENSGGATFIISNLLGYNPLSETDDYDGDGYTNKEELDAGTDPMDASSFPGVPPQLEGAPTASTTGLITTAVGAAILGALGFRRKKR